LCLWLRNKKHYEIASQLLRSGTSIGANIEEASASCSRKEFFQKMSIASKEARETHYWLRLLKDTDIMTDKQTSHLLAETEELIKMLTSIVKKGNATDNNLNLKPKT
jgi:four helix bundle protein